MAGTITFCAGIALLTCGLLVMRHGLKRLLWQRLYKLLSAATHPPWRGLLAGAVAAALFQSSTAVCLLTIGLVTAEYLTFRRSIGIILGANIGTCSTVGLLGFVNTEKLAPVMLIVAVATLAIRKTRNFGVAAIGLASMFCGLYLLNRGVAVFQEYAVVEQLILSASKGAWNGIAAGIIVTILFQSSSAATAMLMTLAQANVFDLTAAAHIVYGANLGSCFSSVLVSAVAPLAAKRVAAAHVLLNIWGIIMFLPVTEQICSIISRLSGEPAIQVAMLHTVFNVISSLVILPVADPFARLVEILAPRGKMIWR